MHFLPDGSEMVPALTAGSFGCPPVGLHAAGKPPRFIARMKARLLLIAAVLAVGLGACQCSNKPDVGPVEEASTVQAFVR